MNKIILWIALGVAIVALLVAVVGGQSQPPLGASGDVTNFTNLTLDEKLIVGGTTALSGNVTLSTTATTSLSLRSTSSTQGLCIPFNATSTNTLLNLTFAASTTGQSTVGVIPVVRYGACN